MKRTDRLEESTNWFIAWRDLSLWAGETQHMGMALNLRHLGTFAILAVGLAGFTPASAADSAFGGLAGSWGGSGMVKYTDGSIERMRCSARYSGGDSDVSLSINCASSAHNIDLTGRLHSIGGHVGGSWNESNMNMSGSATGHATPGRLSLGLDGGVSGSMLVSYTDSHQSVSIKVDNVTLDSVSMSLGKQ
jgi:hypothetical protein